tara:strand:+ start:4880 stop:5272 length:393 start_codon:yes stop_codon:yes gene_type:complete
MRIIRTETDKPTTEAIAIAGKLIPFRAPHWTTGVHGLTAELRLAAGGVLYLDNAAEFRFSQVEGLAQVIEQGGALPLAVIVDTLDPFRAGGGEPDSKASETYRARLDFIVALLEQAANVAAENRKPAFGS